jgi:hypothetical protein
MMHHEHHSYAPQDGVGFGSDQIFFAEIWPNEGLDLVMQNAGFTSGGSTPANTFLGLFTGYTASTVGSSASVADSYAEPTGGAYARQTIAAASWGAIASTTSGRISTCAQISYTQATGSYSAAVNGFMLNNILSSTADKTYFAANFDDTTAVTINTNDQIKVTPSVIFGG